MSAAQVRQTKDGHPVKLDTAICNALNSKLKEYFEAIMHEPVDVQKAECDFLIESSTDSLVRNHVAQTIYDHYADSPVMGFEAVAIHIYDGWFKTGRARMRSDIDMLGAGIFAEFNRQSQIGCKAPELMMTAPDGTPVCIFGPDDKADRFRVLYFYDTDCVKCRMQSILLGNVLETEDFPVDFNAIYTGDNREAWEKYVSERFDIGTSKASVRHMWDPEIDSDFQRKYGILQTPRLFLVAPDGTIIGRGLDAVALSSMLHSIFDEVELEYGGKESAALYDGIFSGSSPSASDVKAVADRIAASTLPKGDTVMFRQMTGDLLYYLSSRSGEGVKEGMDYLIDTYILSDNRAWRSADDSLKVVGLARIMDELLSKAAVGEVVADIKVPGVRIDRKGEKSYSRSLRRLRGDRNIIIFYTAGCNVCDAEKQAARDMLARADRADGRLRVLMVNVDELLADDPSLATRLFDSFDLSSLPFILETDRKGVVLRRYMSLVQ